MTEPRVTSPRASETLAELGEFGLIDRITARIAGQSARGVLVGAGDDSAVLAVPTGPLVVTVDMLVEGRDFRRAWSTAEQVGRKSMAASLADVAAMGALPWVAVVAFGAPADLDAAWAVNCAAGLQAEAESAGAGVVGGDVSAADDITVSVTVIGDLDGRSPILRSGARPGDVVALAGRLGWSAAGLAVLTSGAVSDAAAPCAEVIEAHRCPRPPYAQGPAASLAGATAMIDVSDGLLADTGHIAQASGVVVRLMRSTLQPGPEVLGAAEHLGGVVGPGGPGARTVDDMATRWVLTGGEDHALLASFPGPDVPAGFRVIGIVEAAGPAGAGVWLDDEHVSGPGGFRHFSQA